MNWFWQWRLRVLSARRQRHRIGQQQWLMERHQWLLQRLGCLQGRHLQRHAERHGRSLRPWHRQEQPQYQLSRRPEHLRRHRHRTGRHPLPRHQLRIVLFQFGLQQHQHLRRNSLGQGWRICRRHRQHEGKISPTTAIQRGEEFDTLFSPFIMPQCSRYYCCPQDISIVVRQTLLFFQSLRLMKEMEQEFSTTPLPLRGLRRAVSVPRQRTPWAVYSARP